MYVQIQENNQCSKCGTMNYTESVTREMKTFIRCRSCGHEKHVSTLTVSNPTGGTTYQNLDNDVNKIKEF